jgi:hypothetical protein
VLVEARVHLDELGAEGDDLLGALGLVRDADQIDDDAFAVLDGGLRCPDDVASGAQNRAIAEQLGVTVRTR